MEFNVTTPVSQGATQRNGCMKAFSLWPFVESDTDDLDQVKAQACEYLKYAIATGLCVSAILADAFQSPPTTVSVVARAAFVGELVAKTEGRD